MAEANKELNLEALLKQKEKADREREELDQKIRQAQEAGASSNYEKVVELLSQSGRYLSIIQRNTIIRLVKPDDGSARRERGASPRTPKFQLDNGLTWSGHGKKTKGFDEWAASAEGKRWQAANPGQKFPSYPNHKASGGQAASPAPKSKSK